jgi:hypothetical protein
MVRNQFWIFVGFMVVFGLAVEGAKHINWIPSRANALSTHWGADDTPMFAKGNEHIRLGRGYGGNESFRASGFERVAGLESGGGNEAVKPAAAAAKIDKKAEKKVDKKDNKKKKTKKIPVAPSPTPVPTPTDKEKKAAEDAAAEAAAGAGPGIAAAAEPVGAAAANLNAPAIPVTLEQWQAYVLSSPDFTRTSFMIQMYQTGVLKADVYFVVAGQMSVDPRDKMRELGVMALGATPSSRSFTLLIGVLDNTREVTRTKSQAKTYLKLYTQVQNLKTLSLVLAQDSDPHVTTQALILLQLAAQTYIKQTNEHISTTPPGGTGTPADPRSPAATPTSRYFDPFLSILTQLEHGSHDTSVRTSAGQALIQLHTLLGH